MALVAVVAVVDIPTHVRMTEFRRVPAAVAIRTLEHLVVARIGVTGRANPVRVPVIDREVSVIKGRSRPRCRGVAGRTRIRETCGLVIRVSRAVVVRLVATHTCRRQRRVVVVYVATGAGHGGVRAGQRERRCVVVERGPTPIGGAVAGITRIREPDLCVVRICGFVVVRQVTGYASHICRGQTVVPVHVALAALQ